MSTDYLSAEWLGRRWDKSTRWITEQARAKTIPGAMKVGRQWRFDRAEIEAHEAASKAANPLALSPGAAARQKKAA